MTYGGHALAYAILPAENSTKFSFWALLLQPYVFGSSLWARQTSSQRGSFVSALGAPRSLLLVESCNPLAYFAAANPSATILSFAAAKAPVAAFSMK